MDWEKELTGYLDETSRPWEARLSHYLVEAQWSDLSQKSLDLDKSLHSLCKSNDGMFKSEAQGKFLHAKLRGSLKAWEKLDNPKKWVPEYDPKTHSDYLSVQRLDQFGHRNQSKIRYSAFGFILDGYGVKAKIKFKVNVKPDQPNWGQIDEASGEVVFRRSKQEGPHFVDLTGEEARKKKEHEARVAKNKPTIDLIKSAKGWEGSYMLKSFMEQLQDGRSLSLKQVEIMNRELRKLGVGGLEHDWQSWEDAIKFVRQKLEALIPAAKQEYIKAQQREKEEIQKHWDNRRQYDIDLHTKSGITKVQDMHRWKRMELRSPEWAEKMTREQLAALCKGEYKNLPDKYIDTGSSGDTTPVLFYDMRKLDGDLHPFRIVPALHTTAKMIDKAKRKVRIPKSDMGDIYDLLQIAKKFGWTKP